MATATDEAGYGAEHKRLRRKWAPKVKRGVVFCWRCGNLIELDPSRPSGEQWHLGHDDDDRSVYRGPEHAACNLRTAAHRAQRRVRVVPTPAPVLRQSRKW